MNTEPQTLLTIKQAAHRVGVSPATIRRWAKSGYINGYKVGTRGDWRFEPGALKDVVIRSGTEPAPPTSSVPAVAKRALLPVHAILEKSEKTSHFVQFYENDAFLINSLSEYVASGLLAGEACIIIATQAHIDAVEKKLASNSDVDLSYSQWQGRYLALDATDTLASFMVDGTPDRTKFFLKMSALVEKMTQHRVALRAYGEMVALLWEQGNYKAVLQLEELWNDLAKSYEFILFCAYPLAAFHDQQSSEYFSNISHAHNHTIPAESYSMLETANERQHAITVLQQKAESLDEAVERCEHLRLLNESKDEFISIASHQLRTPATGVKQYTGMLLENFSDPLTENQRAILELAYESNERQLKVIEDLLRVASLDAGKITLDKEVCDIGRLVREVAREQGDTIKDRQQSLSLSVPEGVMVAADHRYLRMVFENLLSNASKYSLAQANIKIAAYCKDDVVHIDFTDTGIGIDREDQVKLFQKFVRINNPHSRTVDGNGLGLYWSRKIIDLHDGRLTLASELEAGSTFTVQLPAYQ